MPHGEKLQTEIQLPSQAKHPFHSSCGRNSSVGRAPDRGAGGCGFDSRGGTNAQGLKITEK